MATGKATELGWTRGFARVRPELSLCGAGTGGRGATALLFPLQTSLYVMSRVPFDNAGIKSPFGCARSCGVAPGVASGVFLFAPI